MMKHDRSRDDFEDAMFVYWMNDVARAEGAEMETELAQTEMELPPETLNARVRKTIHRTFARRRRRVALRRVAAAVLIVLLGTGVWLGVDAPARAVLSNWWTRIDMGDRVSYRFAGELPPEEMPLYGPDWLPEGMVKSEETAEPWLNNKEAYAYIRKLWYRVPDTADYIEFVYFYMAMGMKSNVENFSEWEPVSIGGLPGDYYGAAWDATLNTLIWVDEDNGIVFQLAGTPEKTVLLSVAESVTLRQSVPLYLPTWAPEDPKEAKRMVTENSREIIYRDPSTTRGFTLSCYRLSQPRNTEFVPEDAVWEKLKVHGLPCQYYADTSDRARKLNYLIWTDEKNDLEFCILGNYDKAELLKIARSVKPQ